MPELKKQSFLRRAEAAFRTLVGSTALPAGTRRVVLARRGSFRGAESSRLFGDVGGRTVSTVEELRDTRVLRGRARDLARNDPLAVRFLTSLPANVLGPNGPQLRPQVRDAQGNLDKRVNTAIRAWWDRYCAGPVTVDQRMNWDEFQLLSFNTMVTDGETFTRTVMGPERRHGVAFQGLDADLVDETYIQTAARDGAEVWLGVAVNAEGAPIGYWVWDGLYSQTNWARNRKFVPGSQITHTFISKRFNQARGISWFAPVIVPSQHLNGYLEAVIVGARAGASQMAFVELDMDAPGAVDTNPEATPEQAAQPVEIEIEPGQITRLAPGEKVSAYNPAQPTDLFDPFTLAIMRFIAAGLPTSYAQLSGDYSKASWSSERAAQLENREILRSIQKAWVRGFNQPLYEKALEGAVLSGELNVGTYDWRRLTAAKWRCRGWKWVNPKDEVDAYERELALNITSLTRLADERGEDLEDVLEERRDEIALGKLYGLDLRMAHLTQKAGAPAAAPTDAPPPADEPDADDEPPTD